MISSVDRRQKFWIGSCAEPVVSCSVGGEKGNFDSAVTEKTFAMSDIFMVVSIGTVFIFDLHHDDRSVLCELKRFDEFEDAAVIGVLRLEKRLVHAAQVHPRFRQEPGGKGAEIPFGTDVATGAQDDHKSFLLRDSDIFHEIEPSGEIETAFAWFVEIPAEIGFKRIQPALTQFYNAVAPVVRMDAEIVHCTRTDLCFFSVDQNVASRNENGILRHF